MPIRRRITKFKKLAYHARFGSILNPPLEDDPRWGPHPWPPNGALGIRTFGLIVSKNGTHNYGFPKKVQIDVANVIIGIIRNHDNQRGGIGPGQGFSSWVATKILVKRRVGYIDLYYEVDPKTGKQKPISRADLMLCWKYSCRAEPKKRYYLSDHDHAYRNAIEMNLEEEAVESVYIDYEELHGVRFPWKSMRYRKPRVRSEQ